MNDLQAVFEKAAAQREESNSEQPTLASFVRERADKNAALLAAASAKPREVNPGRRISNKQLVQVASACDPQFCGEIDETLPPDGSVVLKLYNDSARIKLIRNALDPHTPTAGGYLVPGYDVLDALEIALQAHSAMRRQGSVIRRDQVELRVPETNDTSNEGVLIAPNSSAASQDIVFSARAGRLQVQQHDAESSV